MAQSYVEAACVCLARHHKSPVVFSVNQAGNKHDRTVDFLIPDDRTRNAHANEIDATETGAYGLSLAAVESVVGMVAVRRAETQTGADWYIACCVKFDPGHACAPRGEIATSSTLNPTTAAMAGRLLFPLKACAIFSCSRRFTSLLEPALIRTDIVARQFLQILQAASSQDQAQLEALVPKADYRNVFLKLSRNLAPTGKSFGSIEFQTPTGEGSIALTQETRTTMNQTLKKYRPDDASDSPEKDEELIGTLRAVDLWPARCFVPVKS